MSRILLTAGTLSQLRHFATTTLGLEIPPTANTAVILSKIKAAHPDLVDFDAIDPIVEEALRLARIPDNGIELHNVTMEDVDAAGDVVEARNLIPHSWAGERLPPGGRIR